MQGHGPEPELEAIRKLRRKTLRLAGCLGNALGLRRF
jgi:hypothetical protein